MGTHLAERLVFLGTPLFAARHLEFLLQKGISFAGVFCQPDRLSGRGKKKTPPPVKTLAQRWEIPVFQPESINEPEAVQALEQLRPDRIVVVAYGQILRKRVRMLPEKGLVNVHASLLPAYRGAAPLHRALLSGEKRTGISLMKITAGMDSGPFFWRKAIAVPPLCTLGTLEEKLVDLGSHMLWEFLQDPLFFSETPQPEGQASLAPKVQKEDLLLRWTQSAPQVANRIRAFDPEPGCLTAIHGQVVKLFGVKGWLLDATPHTPGTIVRVEKQGAWVCCANGMVLVERIQFPSKKPVFFFQAQGSGKIAPGQCLESLEA
ncbi:MAG TPA: methionyl-tRNA formyltransferase [Thermotogota bacterium]|nr:methionyl-tRNA formyltransferase [Thermotogota bacterium]